MRSAFCLARACECLPPFSPECVPHSTKNSNLKRFNSVGLLLENEFQALGVNVKAFIFRKSPDNKSEATFKSR